MVRSFHIRLTAKSPALRAGIDPGKGGDFGLMPEFWYVHPMTHMKRPAGAPLDAGACPPVKE